MVAPKKLHIWINTSAVQVTDSRLWCTNRHSHGNFSQYISTTQKPSPHRHILFNIRDEPYFICTSQISIIILNQNALFFKTNTFKLKSWEQCKFRRSFTPQKKIILSDISMPLHEDNCTFLCRVEYKHLKLWGVVF